jgi:GDSL-like lipase/acylhydrolase family protein
MQRLSVIAVAIAAGLAGAFLTKLQARWVGDCGHVSCSYVQTRLALVDQMIAAREKGPAYLVIGDSLTEIGAWPTLCGHIPVAAGISGARSDTWLLRAKAVAKKLQPEFVVLALGTNDVLTQGRLGPYEQLASSLSDYRLVAAPVHGMPGAPPEAVREANRRIKAAVKRTADPVTASTTDGVHLTAEDYARWFGAIEKAACHGDAPSRQ